MNKATSYKITSGRVGLLVAIFDAAGFRINAVEFVTAGAAYDFVRANGLEVKPTSLRLVPGHAGHAQLGLSGTRR